MGTLRHCSHCSTSLLIFFFLQWRAHICNQVAFQPCCLFTHDFKHTLWKLFFMGTTSRRQYFSSNKQRKMKPCPSYWKGNPYTKSLGSVPKIPPTVIEYPTTTNIQPMFHEPSHELVFSFRQNGGHMKFRTYACPVPHISCATNNMKMLNQENVDRSHPKRRQCHQSLISSAIKARHMKVCT